MRIITLVMIWSIMNNFSISAGMVLKEKAVRVGDSDQAKVKLQAFTEIFEGYPNMTWLNLATGKN